MNFRDRAKKAYSNNIPLTDGKKKVELKSVMAMYPDGFTLSAMAMVHDISKETDYVVCNIREDEKIFFFGGVGLKGLYESLLSDFGNDETALAEEFAKEGLKVKLSEKRSKNNRTYTSVEII